jgi:hypothetical protein
MCTACVHLCKCTRVEGEECVCVHACVRGKRACACVYACVCICVVMDVCVLMYVSKGEENM